MLLVRLAHMASSLRDGRDLKTRPP